MEREAAGLKLKLGDSAPYFSLRGTDGRIHSIADFAGAPAMVVIFTCNHCPYAQAYEQRIVELAKEFQPLGAKFVAVCANDANGYPEDDFPQMVEKAKTLNLPFPYLHDENQVMAQAYDAACTPEVYLFDREHRLQYHGRIDDNYREPSQVTRQDLKEALASVLEGQTPQLQLTPAIGCSIKWKRGSRT
jgi:peroxiredoxin